MSEMKYKIIMNALIGALIGIMIAVMIYVLGGYDDPEPPRLMLLKQVIGSALFGAVNMGAARIYDIENWSIVRVTVTHYALSLGSFVICNILLGWFGPEEILIVFIIFTAVYFLIWLIMYLIGKKQVKALNEELDVIHHGEKEGLSAALQKGEENEVQGSANR